MQANGKPDPAGYLADDSRWAVLTPEMEEVDVSAIRLVVNPEKHGNVPPLEQEAGYTR